MEFYDLIKSRSSQSSQRMSGIVEKTEASSTGCHVCGGGDMNALLSAEEVQRELQTLRPNSKWTLSENQKVISRAFVCKNWQSAINAIQAISSIAERPDIQHHPDLHLTSYRNLEIKIYTHAVDGLTEYDFKLARLIDEIPFEYSPKWRQENSL